MQLQLHYIAQHYATLITFNYTTATTATTVYNYKKYPGKPGAEVSNSYRAEQRLCL